MGWYRITRVLVGFGGFDEHWRTLTGIYKLESVLQTLTPIDTHWQTLMENIENYEIAPVHIHPTRQHPPFFTTILTVCSKKNATHGCSIAIPLHHYLQAS